jgi:hypothetical protein
MPPVGCCATTRVGTELGRSGARVAICYKPILRFADEQNEARRLRDLLREFGQPETAGAQRLGREEGLCDGILASQRRLERLYNRKVLRIIGSGTNRAWNPQGQMPA